MAVISSRVHCNLLGLLTALLVQGVVGDLRGVGQEGDHCVEQGLDPLVLQGAAHEHREELALQAGTPDPRHDLLLGRCLLLQVHLPESLVCVGHVLNELVAALLHLRLHVGWRLIQLHLLPVLAQEVDRPAVDEVDDPLVVPFQPNGKLQQRRIVVQLGPELRKDPERVGTGPVEFVDEGDAGHGVALHLAAHSEGLRLHPSHGAQHEHRPVQHT
uniref:Putative secreted protein n=1 Tax=Ixodes ricinus TaxID=34613 RepID=A0A6B0V298_IXORI